MAVTTVEPKAVKYSYTGRASPSKRFARCVVMTTARIHTIIQSLFLKRTKVSLCYIK